MTMDYRTPRFLVAAGAVAAVLVTTTFFAVDETQTVVVTQFGRAVRVIKDAGLHAKLPWQTRITFDKRLQTFNPRPTEFLTRDKKNLVVDSFICWRVADPQRFLQSVNDVPGAEMRLRDILWSELSIGLGQQELSHLVSTRPEEVKVAQIMADVTQRCRQTSKDQYGIDVIDVRIKRINLPEQNRDSVFKRMEAERERIARQYRAEGEEQATRIVAEAERQKTQILATAYEKAEKIRGEGDAASMRIYASAYNRDPQFYKMTRTLDAYKRFLNDKTTVILSSDSELLKLLTQGRSGSR
jgi:membrane protease subunit HflC